MVAGFRIVKKPKEKVIEKLKIILAGANCEITEQTNELIRFKHGTYFTQTISMVPKIGTIKLHEEEKAKTYIEYDITVALFPKIFYTLFGIILCFTIFAPIVVYIALVIHPRKFIENILNGV